MTSDLRMPPLALLAGGRATRLGWRTDSLAKSLVPVAGEPFIAHQLRLLADRGVRKVVICIGHLGEQIRRFVGDGSTFGLEVSYSHDGETLLGTGGALRRALPLLEDPFWTMYGDSYLDIDLEPTHEAFLAASTPALMTVYHNANRLEPSNVLLKRGRILRYDKKNPGPEMEHVDFGLSLVTKRAFEEWERTEAFDLGQLFAALAERGSLAGFEVEQRFYEIGSPAGLAETERHLCGKAGTDAGVHVRTYLAETAAIAQSLDRAAIERMVEILRETRDSGGRLFFLGVGGSAANASHAVNDFRKIANIEAYTPTDNVSELTARINDDGWESVFADWLMGSRLNENDVVWALSVGGGSLEKNVSPNLVVALQYAKKMGARILAVVGRDGGFAARVADACVVVPTMSEGTVTPHTEAFQSVVWHLLVSHPDLRINEMKWESVAREN